MNSVSIDTDVRIPGRPAPAAASAAAVRTTITAARRIVNVAKRAADPWSVGNNSSRLRIGHLEKNPGTTRNSTASVAITPIAACNPNTRIGSSSLTTSEISPSAVVPEDRVQGSQPVLIARRAAPSAGPCCRASTR